MQPSLTKPPMSGDETATPITTQLPPLSPELPVQEQAPATPIAETPPQGKANDGRILLPKALVDDLYREARKNFALIPDMTFALAAGSRALRDLWEHKDGKFLRKERPFANYIPPKDSVHGPFLREAKAHPVSSESPAVAAARARWAEAKREGDPGRMTRTANDLLRATEAEQPHAESLGKPPVSSSVSAAEAASERGASGVAEHTTLLALSEDEPIPESASRTSEAARSDVANAKNRHDLSEPSLYRLASDEADDEPRWGWGTMRDWLSEDAPEEQFGTAHVKPDVHPDAPAAGLRRIRIARQRARQTGRPPERAGSRSHWADPNVGWTEPEMRETLAHAATRPLTAEGLLTWSSWIYPDEHRDREGKPVLPHTLGVQGWRIIDWIDDENSGYYGMAIYNPRTNEVVMVSRGTEFNRDAIHRADEAAAIDIFQGKVTRQLQLSHILLKRVWKAFQHVAKKPRYYATGHSLGGASAQFQVAAGYADPELKGMQIYGVTFAAVGASDAIHAMASEGGPWRRPGWIHLDRIANDRIRNYVRVGDGFVMQRTGRRRRPGRFGGDRLMAGLHMSEIEGAERTPWESRRDPWLSRQIRQGSLEGYYFDNHSLKSYYSSDFVKPVDQLFDHVWDHYVQ